MCLPSWAQLGSSFRPACVSCRRPRPSGATVKICGVPATQPWKAILSPVGDQSGPALWTLPSYM